MAQILSLIIQKIAIFSLGLCGISYQIDDNKFAQSDSKVTAFEIQYGNNSHGFTASFDNESGKTNWENLNLSSQTHLRRLNFTFVE